MATRQIGTEAVHSNYELNDILNQTQAATSRSGGFRRVLGAIAGGAANIFMPGIGSLLGGMIGGTGGVGGLSGLGSETTQFFQFMQRFQAENRAFETAVQVSKARHDASMSAIRSISSR